VDYPDGTSAIAIWLNNATEVAIMHPNGTSDIVSITEFQGGMGAQLIQSGVSTASIMGQRTMGKLPGWICGGITGGAGYVTGWAATVIGELLTDGTETVVAPWVYKAASWGGSTLTGAILWSTGACG
jgi:hypothetical protein